MGDSTTAPQDVLDFWADAGPKAWWKKDDAFDDAIRTRFAETLIAAGEGRLDRWRNTPDGTLALLIVLDQFSRNLHRNSADAFANDPRALAIAEAAIDSGDDHAMRSDLAAFCYMPLMHSEQLRHQRQCLAEFERLELEGNIKAAKEHLDIIERFGRFPHRNSVLGRETTDEERAFLDAGGFSG